MNIPIIKLNPPDLTDNHIDQQVTCIRPHRERIFRVESTIVNDKIIFHNYGQGGAGWTFLFGCVQQSIEQFEQYTIPKNEDIRVIGAGCYGLLTAILLTLKGYRVQIIADAFEELTSDKAAGFFFPRHRKCSNESEIEQFNTLGRASYEQYALIASHNHPLFKTGAQLLPAYYGLDIDPGFQNYIEEKLMPAPRPVVISFGKNHYQALEYQTIFIDPSQMMKELRELVKDLNVQREQKRIISFNDINSRYIFNCSGYGAKQLADDKKIVPVQGHLITLKNQPSLPYMLNFKVVQYNAEGKPRDELIYFAPKNSGILGITFIRGQENPAANFHEFERLIKRCRDFFG